MNYDEFAFFNQQLAAMLRDGIPLEAALGRLCAEMRQGKLRTELEKLGADLAKGVPLREAARARDLPDLYRQLLEVGVASNDLPGVLTLLADYYQRRHLIWTQLKGLMVYPVIVLTCAFGLSIFLSALLSYFIQTNFLEVLGGRGLPASLFLTFWLPPMVLGLLAAGVVLGMTVGPLRRRLRWRLPAFKEASVAQVGWAMSMMLKSGVPLPEALGLAKELERGSPAQDEIAGWSGNLAAGRGKFAEMAPGGKVFPPLFVWMVGHAGEDVAAGFQKASELFQARAAFKTEMLLYSALPCAVLGLGLMIIAQITPALAQFVELMRWIGQ